MRIKNQHTSLWVLPLKVLALRIQCRIEPLYLCGIRQCTFSQQDPILIRGRSVQRWEVEDDKLLVSQRTKILERGVNGVYKGTVE